MKLHYEKLHEIFYCNAQHECMKASQDALSTLSSGFDKASWFIF